MYRPLFLRIKKFFLDIKIKNSTEDEDKRIITLTPYGSIYEDICEAII